jgi:translation initiation factor 1A
VLGDLVLVRAGFDLDTTSHRGPKAWERTSTAHKTPAEPRCVSHCNGASSNRLPNNKKKSGGSKRNTSLNKDKRELLFAEDGQQYAKLTKRLGDGRFEALCLVDGQERLAHVRGKLWKRVWVLPGDLVLLGLRAFQDQKADILHKYTADEERSLCSIGEVPARIDRCERDPHYQDQWTRNVDGASRTGFLPTEDDFGFDEDA